MMNKCSNPTSWENTKGFDTTILFNVPLSSCPDNVKEEVKVMWRDEEFGNDFYIFEWDSEFCNESYPIIDEYLKLRGVTKCLIHWWW